MFIYWSQNYNIAHSFYIYIFFTFHFIRNNAQNRDIYEDDNNDTSNFSSSQCKHKFQFSLGLKRTL